MKNIINILIATLVFILLLQDIFAQRSSSDEKLRKARILMNDYQDAALFRNMNNGTYDPSWEDIFRDLFRTGKIVFDIPFRVDGSVRRDASLRPDIDDKESIIRIYQEEVSIETYIETIRNAYGYFGLTDFVYAFVEIRFDTLNLSSQNKILFEYRKNFSQKKWSVRDSRSYLFEIEFFDRKPFITSVRAVDEEVVKSEVVLAFINSNLRNDEPGYLLPNVSGFIKLEYEETPNISLIAGTDSSGILRLGLIPNQAIIKIDSAFGIDRERFSVPSDWRSAGKRVSSQPSGGFQVPLLPWTWNGFSWAGRSFVGMILQSKNQLSNFSDDSEFSNKIGYKYGLGVEVVKNFNFDQVSSIFGPLFLTTDHNTLKTRRNTFLGVGTGISYYNLQYRITSKGFLQSPFHYLDRLEAPVQVVVSGSSYRETVSSSGVSMPVFLEFRKILPKRIYPLHTVSFQAGLNLLIPFEINYSSEGIFSRHGYYEQFNPQPITSDAFYNYYTNSEISYDDIVLGNTVLPAWMFRFNGFFNLTKGKSDNLLDVGILITLPFTRAGNTDPETFYLATGNDVFSSLIYSRKEIFDYFIGISIGYNFINYRIY